MKSINRYAAKRFYTHLRGVWKRVKSLDGFESINPRELCKCSGAYMWRQRAVAEAGCLCLVHSLSHAVSLFLFLVSLFVHDAHYDYVVMYSVLIGNSKYCNSWCRLTGLQFQKTSIKHLWMFKGRFRPWSSDLLLFSITIRLHLTRRVLKFGQRFARKRFLLPWWSLLSPTNMDDHGERAICEMNVSYPISCVGYLPRSFWLWRVWRGIAIRSRDLPRCCAAVVSNFGF